MVDTGYRGHSTRNLSPLLEREERAVAKSAICCVRAAVGRETSGTRGSASRLRACLSSSTLLWSRDFGFLERVACEERKGGFGSMLSVG